LTAAERAILEGSSGEVLSRALASQLEVGEFFNASHFVPITHAHFTGDYEVMGEAGYRYLAELMEAGARVGVPTTRNSICVDLLRPGCLWQSQELLEAESRVGEVLRRLGVATVNTCIGYQTVYQPRFGEHVAWGDSGAVAYANAVLGARTNIEAGPFSLLAALTGRTPAYGFHLPEHRRATVHCRTAARLSDTADWGVLGMIVGQRYCDYWTVPVFECDYAPSPDDLKHLAASLASYGGMAMFHVVGATPEAPSLAGATGGRALEDEIEISDQEIQGAYARFRPEGGPITLVAFTAPQLSFTELEGLARLFTGRRVHQNVKVIVTTNSMLHQVIREQGILGELERAGVCVVVGTCWYLMAPGQMRRQYGWDHVVTNSSKLANIIKAHGFEPILRRTHECVKAAASGNVVAARGGT
jgi:predicted aconitase